MSDIAIKIENLKKQYRLGTIGGQTLNAELQSWWARRRGKEDPNLKIGEEYSDTEERFWALRGINLEIRRGEALGIIGANGAGKSTLLKILSRVTAPTEGDIWINGRISSMLEVGTGFHAELTGRENIYMNGAILGMTKKEVDSKIESIIDFSECRQFIDTPVKRYSSGMYVKLAFAVASHLDAEIMVMDEVLAVGDVKFQKKCLGKMGDAAENEGKTVLYVSHNMATIRSLCTRCIVLNKGQIIFDGDVDKAISIYMDASDKQLQNKYDLRDIKRTQAIFGKKVFIKQLEFYDREIPRYFQNEEMKFRLTWEGKESLEQLRVRMEIRYADGTIIGMTESKSFSNVEKGKEYSSSFGFAMSNFAPGKYYFRLSLFLLGENGVHEGIDEIAIPVSFEVEEQASDETTWLRQYWGSVKFNPINIV